MDELRVGTYVYGDRACIANGSVPLEDCALRVVATVVSRPTRDRAIIDAGSKTLTSDLAIDQTGLGQLVEHPEAEDLRPERGARVRRRERLRRAARDRRPRDGDPEPCVHDGEHARPDRPASRWRDRRHRADSGAWQGEVSDEECDSARGSWRGRRRRIPRRRQRRSRLHRGAGRIRRVRAAHGRRHQGPDSGRRSRTIRPCLEAAGCGLVRRDQGERVSHRPRQLPGLQRGHTTIFQECRTRRGPRSASTSRPASSSRSRRSRASRQRRAGLLAAALRDFEHEEVRRSPSTKARRSRRCR